MSLRKQQLLLSLAIPLVLVLTACSAGGQNPAPGPEPEPEPGVTTLIYAQISEDGVDREWLDKFNSDHEGEIQIAVRDYSQMSEGGQQGIDLLITEIASGKIPDIIELGTSGETTEFSYRKLAEGGYLEDLWPYIENDPSLGRAKVIEAPLKASEINGGLYVAFDSFWLHTMLGSKSVVGDRIGWTVEDLLEAFDTMPEGSVIVETFRDYSMREHLLASFLYGFSDLFIDWEDGRCFFDNETFRSILDLVKRVPDKAAWHEYYPEESDRYAEYRHRQMDGVAMLSDLGLTSPRIMQQNDFFFDGVTCIGYPVGDGSTGAYIEPTGIKLAMSSTCKDKEAAWQYIRRTFLPRSSSYPFIAAPINTQTYRRLKAEDLRFNGGVMLGSEVIRFGEPVTKEQYEYVEALFDTPRSSILLDKNVRDIVLEVAGAYFAGDRDLDQTVQMLNSRVSLYLNEQR